MSRKPVITVQSSYGDVFSEGTYHNAPDDVIGWRAVKPYPHGEISLSIFWDKTGNAIPNPSRLAAVRKHVIPMLKEGWAPAPEQQED